MQFSSREKLVYRAVRSVCRQRNVVVVMCFLYAVHINFGWLSAGHKGSIVAPVPLHRHFCGVFPVLIVYRKIVGKIFSEFCICPLFGGEIVEIQLCVFMPDLQRHNIQGRQKYPKSGWARFDEVPQMPRGRGLGRSVPSAENFF